MKIAYIVNHLGHTGGLNNMVLDMATLFTQNGHDCCVYYFKTHEPEIVFPCKTQKISKLSRIDFSTYDVVHCHGIWPNAYVLLHKPFKKVKTKFVATLHCYVFQDFKDLYGTLKGFLGSFLFLASPLRMDTIVTLSRDAMRYYKRWYPWKRLTYAYNTRLIDNSKDLTPEEKNELLGIKGDGVLIGMNSNLILRKGIDTMLEAMSLLPSKYRLAICGGYASPEVEALWEKMKDEYKDRVFLLGLRKEAYRYLPYYDIYVLASRSEGFPLSLVEASAYGNKIVTTNLPQLKEVFTDEDVSYSIPGNAKSLAEAVLRVDQLSDHGAYQEYQEKLCPEKFYQRYLSIYQGKDSLEY